MPYALLLLLCEAALGQARRTTESVVALIEANSTGCGQLTSCCVVEKERSIIAGFRSPTCRCMPMSQLTCKGRHDEEACDSQRVVVGRSSVPCRDYTKWSDIVDARWPDFRQKKQHAIDHALDKLFEWNQADWYKLQGRYKDTSGIDCFSDRGGRRYFGDNDVCWTQYQDGCIEFDQAEYALSSLLAFCQQQEQKYGGPWQMQCGELSDTLTKYTKGLTLPAVNNEKREEFQPWRGISYCFRMQTPELPTRTAERKIGCYADRRVAYAKGTKYIEHVGSGSGRKDQTSNILKCNPRSARDIDISDLLIVSA